MTFKELYDQMLKIFPNGEIGEDNDGQLVIYTDLELNGDGESLDKFEVKKEPKYPNYPAFEGVD